MEGGKKFFNNIHSQCVKNYLFYLWRRFFNPVSLEKVFIKTLEVKAQKQNVPELFCQRLERYYSFPAKRHISLTLSVPHSCFSKRLMPNFRYRMEKKYKILFLLRSVTSTYSTKDVFYRTRSKSCSERYCNSSEVFAR